MGLIFAGGGSPYSWVRCDALPFALLIRSIAIPTGRDAIRLEKETHRTLRERHPQAVLDRGVFAGQVNCASELYDAAIETDIMALLDELQQRVAELE